MDRLHTFLDSLFFAPGSRIGAHQLRLAFLATLDERERPLWPKWRFLADLQAAGFLVARDSDNVLHVANFSLAPPPRYEAIDGRLRLVRN